MLRQIIILAGLTLSLAAQAQDTQHRISMTMKDADLADVMDLVSREQRVNVFVSTESTETVSFSLYDMTVPDAIRAIAPERIMDAGRIAMDKSTTSACRRAAADRRVSGCQPG